MTLFEALKFNREPLEMLISLGGKQDDLRFIDLYTEYEVMNNKVKRPLMQWRFWQINIR